MVITERKKLLIYKVLIIIFAFVIAFLPSTASRNREVNSRIIVEMIGLDEKDGNIEVTAQYVMPTETEGATTKDKVKVSAKTVTQAVESLSTALGRRAELGHCSMLILGSELKPHTLASLMTGTDVTADVYVSAATESAGELVGDLTDFMKKSGTTDADFIAYSAKRSHIATTTLLNFLSDIKSASKTATVPIVELIEEEGGQSGEQSGGDSGSSSGGGESGGSGGGSGGDGSSGGGQKQPIGMKTEKLALYNDEARIGVLEKQSSRGVAWICPTVEKSVVCADIEYDGKKYEGVSGYLARKQVNMKIDKKSKACIVEVSVRIDPKCDKFNFINTSSDGKAREAIKQGFEQQIKSELISGFGESLNLGADPMKIAKKFYRYAPKLNVTAETLGEVAVNFDVKVEIN